MAAEVAVLWLWLGLLFRTANHQVHPRRSARWAAVRCTESDRNGRNASGRWQWPPEVEKGNGANHRKRKLLNQKWLFQQTPILLLLLLLQPTPRPLSSTTRMSRSRVTTARWTSTVSWRTSTCTGGSSGCSTTASSCRTCTCPRSDTSPTGRFTTSATSCSCSKTPASAQVI